LFLERASQLRSIEAHVIYTLRSISRERRAQYSNSLYGTPPFVLPMVKVFHPAAQQALPEDENV